MDILTGFFLIPTNPNKVSSVLKRLDVLGEVKGIIIASKV